MLGYQGDKMKGEALHVLLNGRLIDSWESGRHSSRKEQRGPLREMRMEERTDRGYKGKASFLFFN